MTLFRSLIVGLLAVAAARLVRALLADRRRPVRRMAWVLLLAPYFTPVLLTGYAYANFSLSLIHHPAINSIFYSALLWWKFTPIAAVMLHFTPAAISAEAIHCRRLAAGASPFSHGWFLVRAGCAAGPAAAFAVVFLCAFAEFEMASLMVVKSWTVALFDAHAGGLALSESLRRMAGPLLCESAAIATVFAVLGRQRSISAQPIPGGRLGRGLAWCHLLIAFIVMLAIPATMVLWGTIRGLGLLLENFVLGREILASLLFAAGASAFAGLAVFGLAHLDAVRGGTGRAATSPPPSAAQGRRNFSHWWHWSRCDRSAAQRSAGTAESFARPNASGNQAGPGTCVWNARPRRPWWHSSRCDQSAAQRSAGAAESFARPNASGNRFWKIIFLAAVFTGLLGPLVLSLAVLAAVQLPGLIALRDTPAPLVFALGLVLLPMAFVLQRALELTRRRSALHLATLLQKSRAARELTWRLSTSGKFWAMVLLFVWAYWDLTAGSILAPIGMTPVTVRLYNLMHYGQVATLSAMTCAAFAAPIMAALLALGTRRWWAPR